MSDPIQLVSSAEDCVKSAIELLEEALDEIKLGNIKSAAVVVITRENKIKSKTSRTEDRHLLIAGCEYLKQTLMEADD